MRATVPPGHGQVPPHPSDLPDSAPSGGQTGWQQTSPTSLWLCAQLQTPPHPSGVPPLVVPGAQLAGVQQVPFDATVPLGHAQVPPQPSGFPF